MTQRNLQSARYETHVVWLIADEPSQFLNERTHSHPVKPAHPTQLIRHTPTRRD